MTNTAENITEGMSNTEGDVLVVVSKLKSYIKTQSGFNTAGTVAPVLSNMVRVICDRAIENAKKEGRKTVMDRDFTPISF